MSSILEKIKKLDTEIENSTKISKNIGNLKHERSFYLRTIKLEIIDALNLYEIDYYNEVFNNEEEAKEYMQNHLYHCDGLKEDENTDSYVTIYKAKYKKDYFNHYVRYDELTEQELFDLYKEIIK